MNKKKIKSMLIMMGTVLSLNMGNQLEVKADELDKEKPLLQQGNEVSKNNETVKQTNEAENTKETQKVQRIVIARDDYAASTYKGEDQTPAEAVANINAGKGEYQDYRTLRITEAKKHMISSLNEAVKLEKKDKGADLTRREVVNAAEDAIYVYKLMSNINEEYAYKEDFYDANIENVDDSNFEDICTLLKDKTFYRSKEVQAKVDAINKAKSNISQGVASLTDYKEFGIEGVKANILRPINSLVNIKSVDLGRELTIAEVNEIVQSELAKLQAIAVINSGDAYLEDFQTLKINNIDATNFDFIANAIKGHNFETVEQIQAAVDEQNEVLKTIKVLCSGQGSLSDFKKLGIEGVTADNIDAVNAKIVGKNYTELSQVKNSVEMTLKYLLNDKVVKIEKGEASLNDISALGIKGVTEENLAFVTERLKGKTYDSIKAVQDEVYKAVDLFDTLKRINNGIASVEDYEYIEADEVNESNVEFINSEMKRSFDYTVSGLKDKIKSAKSLYDSYVRINNGEAAIEDYTLIGATGVDRDNLNKVNLAVKNQLKDYKSYTKFNVQEIIKVVIGRNESLNSINQGTAKLVDFKQLEISGVTDENLKFMNEGLKGTNPANEFEVQNAVNALLKVYESIVKVNEGNATIEDFTLIDRNSAITSENVNFANYYLKGCKTYSIKGMSDKMAYAVKVYEALTRANNGAASADDFRLLGIDNVPKAQLDYVNEKLAGSKYTTIEGVKDKVNEVLNYVVSLQKINGGNASLADYERFKISGVEYKNLNFINAEIKDKDLKNAEEIQTAVDRANYLYDITVKINDGNGTLKDYEEIKAEGLTEKNLKYVNSFVKDNPSINLITLRNTVLKAANEYYLIEKINQAASEVSDYKALDLVDVNTTNIAYINKKIFENQVVFNIDGTINETVNHQKIKDEIQRFISSCTDVYVSIAKINSGTARLSDYEILKIKNVTEENYIFVNSYLRGNDTTDLPSIQAKVNEAVSEFGAINRINEGSASIDDYKNIIGTDYTVDKETGERVEVPYVNSDNINYINPLIKGKGYTTQASIKSFVLIAVREFKGLERMSMGEALLSDFTDLEIADVNSENLSYINASLKGIFFKSVGDAKKAVDVAINHYNAIERIIRGEAIVGDYALLEIEGVNEDNVAFVNYHLKDKVFTSDGEVKREAEKAFKLYDAIERINNGEGYLADYILVENRVKEDGQSEVIDYVDNVNITFVNKCLMGKNLNQADIIVENIKSIVAKYNALVKMDKGNAALEDYKTIGAGGVTEANLNYVNSFMAGKGYFKENEKAVSNAVEAVVDIVKTYNIITKVNAGTAKLREYQELGIVNKVTEDNLQFINANIKNLNLKTKEEVEAQVVYWAGQYTSFAKINTGAAIINDYINLGLKNVDNSIRLYVNADLKDKNILTTKELQEVIDKHQNIYAALKNINLGNGTEKDYKVIGTSSTLTEENIKFLSVKLKGANVLTDFEARKKVELLLAQNGAYGRINKGIATLEDYTLAGILSVDAYNIDYINTEIKNNVDPYGTNIQSQVNSILELYSSVQVINEGKETATASGGVNIVKDYNILNKSVIAYDESAGSKFSMIREAISLKRKILNGRNLFKSEIISIIDAINSSPEDAKVVLNRIVKESEKAVKQLGRELEASELENISNNIIDNMKQVARRIFTGQGTVEDFYSLGEMEVNVDNIKVINKDIEDYGTVIKLSDYRLKDVDKAVAIGKAILTINNGNETSAVDEYKLLNRSVTYSNEPSSLLGLIRSEVKLERDLQNGAYLNRGQILNIVDEVIKSEEDKKVIIPEILRAVEKAKVDNNGVLTAEAEKAVIDGVISNRKKIIARISKGEGLVSDFEALGEIRVNKDNIDVINTDIKENRTIEKLSELRIGGLAKAVKEGIAIFDINNHNYGASASNYTAIGQSVNYDTKVNSAYTLIGDAITIKKAIKNDEYLTRNEIINIITEVNGSLEDQAVIIPKIIEEMNRRTNKGDKLTSEDVLKIESDVKEKIKNVCIRIRGAEGNLEDFKYLGMTKVNENNIAIINEDIKENHTVAPDGIYRLQGLEDAILDGIAIQYINSNNNDQSLINHFARLKLSLTYDSKESSKFMLILSQIKLNKVLEGGRNLVRKEIVDIVNEVNDEYEDLKNIIPKINSEKSARERSTGKLLTAEETKKLIEEVKTNLRNVCARVSTGQGILEDFIYLGQSKVTAENIMIINNDIKESNKVSLASSYRLTGLEDAINAGIAIYYINNNNTDQSVQEKFKTLGYDDIKHSTEETSLFKLILSKVRIEKAIKELPYLNRSEIDKIITDVRNNYYDLCVIIPKVNKMLPSTLTAEGTNAIVNEVKDTIKKTCLRVLSGEASVEDYNYLGQTDVNADNLKVINEDILANKMVSLISAYRVNGIDEAVKQGLSIYNININKDKTVADSYKALGLDIPYSTESKSLFNLVYCKVEMDKMIKNKEYLNRKDIFEIINTINKNLDDLAVLIPLENKAVHEALTASNKEVLTSDEVNSIIKAVEENLKDACKRVSSGNGTIEDFELLGETRVNKNNIDVINNDIKENNVIIERLSSFRLANLDKAVNLGLAVYNINNNSEDQATSADFATLGISIDTAQDSGSTLKLIETQVKINRMLKDNKNLTRNEIKDVVKEVTSKLEDYKVIIPKINEKIIELNSNLTSDEVNSIIKAVEENLKDACKRVSSGNGTIEDFELLGETRVNKNNIDVINNDIKENNVIIERLSSFRLANLDKAVNLGLAVYNINNNSEDQAASADFAILGINIDTAQDSGNTLKLIETQVKIDRMLQDNKPLTRNEIKEIVKEVISKLEDYKVIIPKVNEKIIESNSNLTSAEVEQLINEVKENIKKVCQRVSIGKGTIEDFEYLGEKRVNKNNIEVINTDIQYNHITPESAYRLKDLDVAVTAGLAIYEINNSAENSGVEDFKKIGIELEFSESDTSLFRLVQSSIKIDRRTKDNRYIRRSEIKEIVDRLRDHLEDAKVIIPTLILKINAAEKPLDSLEISDLVENTMKERKLIISRICSGDATVDDYAAVGIEDITSKNIDIINTEVKKYRNITRISDYRLNSVVDAIKKTNAIYAINLGALNEKWDIRQIHNNRGDCIREIKSNGRVSELEELGQIVNWNEQNDSELGLIKQAVEIMRSSLGGRYLTRSEIINDIVKNIKKNFEDSKLMIPRIYHALNDEKTDRSEELTAEIVNEVIAEQEKIVKDAVDRIFLGEGTVSDYQLFSEIEVNEGNIDLVNNIIKEHRTVTKLTPYRLDGLGYSVKLGFALSNLNSGNVSKSCDEFALLGENIEYSEDATSLFMIIKDQIALTRDLNEGRNLTKNEILNIIAEAREKLEDMQVYVPVVKAAVDKAKMTETLTVDEERKLIETIKSKIMTSINKICNGLGEVEDFVNLGENRVTAENIDYINADIKTDKAKTNVSTTEREFTTIKKLSDFRVSGLTDVVTRGLALYAININKTTKGEDGLVKEYKVLHRKVTYDDEISSLYGIIQKYIMMEKRINDDKPLGRQEILDYMDEVINNFDRYKITMPKIDSEIFAREYETSKGLDSKEVEEIKNSVEKDLKNSIRRIVSGIGTLNDYQMFGEERVNSKNRSVINADIRKYKNIKAVKDYSVSGLTKAVDIGLAVYNLNNATETVTKDGFVNELALLGYEVEYSKEDLSIYQLIKDGINIQRRLEDNNNIGRDSICEVIDFVLDNQTKAANKYPNIISAIETQDQEKDYELTGAEVKVIYDQIMNDTSDVVE